ncbi:hypothetical protein NC653_040806 [Populus alba x Populus x berolinensis]|nr:hypothetical protein NC653_040806 [Populus alba x Populus x berolinensis]
MQRAEEQTYLWSVAPDDEDAAPEDEDEADFLGWFFFFWLLFVLHFSVAALRLSSPPGPSGFSARSLCPVVFVPTVLSSPFVSVLSPLSQSAALLLLRSCADRLSLNVTTRQSYCSCFGNLLLLEERMLDDSCMLTVHGEGVAVAVTGEKKGYRSTDQTVGELVSRGGQEKGDCDGAKTQPGEGFWFFSLFMKREQMVKMTVLVSRQRGKEKPQRACSVFLVIGEEEEKKLGGGGSGG